MTTAHCTSRRLQTWEHTELPSSHPTARCLHQHPHLDLCTVTWRAPGSLTSQSPGNLALAHTLLLGGVPHTLKLTMPFLTCSVQTPFPPPTLGTLLSTPRLLCRPPRFFGQHCTCLLTPLTAHPTELLVSELRPLHSPQSLA